MRNENYSRRKFINKCFKTGSLFLGGALFLSCHGTNESSSNATENKMQSTLEDPCNDLTGVSEGEIKKRQSLG